MLTLRNDGSTLRLNKLTRGESIGHLHMRLGRFDGTLLAVNQRIGTTIRHECKIVEEHAEASWVGLPFQVLGSPHCYSWTNHADKSKVLRPGLTCTVISQCTNLFATTRKVNTAVAMYSQLLQEDSTDIKDPPAGLPNTFVSGKAYDLVGTIPSETNNDATSFHPSLLAKFRLNTNGERIDSGGVHDSLVEARYSWSPVLDTPGAHSDHYALVFLNVNISVQSAGPDKCPRDDPRYEPRFILLPG